jgi:calcium/calmodulin-dependent protein kinase (CaM kinase) II/peptidyl-prolyl isomerase G (cyclophilin G)
MAAKGLEAGRFYMTRNVGKKEDTEKGEDQSFGWNVFGEDAYYKAYDRRCGKLTFDKERYQKQMEDPTIVMKPTEESLNEMVSDLQKQ